MERDGCDEATARSKIEAQMPMELKAERTTLIINNAADKSKTKIDV